MCSGLVPAPLALSRFLPAGPPHSAQSCVLAACHPIFNPLPSPPFQTPPRAALFTITANTTPLISRKVQPLYEHQSARRFRPGQPLARSVGGLGRDLFGQGALHACIYQVHCFLSVTHIMVLYKDPSLCTLSVVFRNEDPFEPEFKWSRSRVIPLFGRTRKPSCSPINSHYYFRLCPNISNIDNTVLDPLI